MARTTLNRDQILKAAIELLDAESVEGLSMRRLGQKLGGAATSVYWHVKNKEDLIVMAADEVWREIELIPPETAGWRVAAKVLATNTAAMVRRHLWLWPATTTYFAYGPGMARHQDHSYAIFEVAGFGGVDLDSAVNTLSTFVFGSTYGEAAAFALQTRIRRDGGDAEQRINAIAGRSRDVAENFPRLAARMRDSSRWGPHDEKTSSFEFSLDAILDGFEVYLKRKSKS